MFGQPDRIDTILINGRILTVDAAFAVVEALAIRDGRVVASGSSAEISALAHTGTDVHDLAGAVAMPGIFDAHNHLLATSEMLADVQLFDTRSLSDIMDRVAARVASTPPGEWVVGRGWDESLLDERRKPTRADLDAIAPDHPVVLFRVWNQLVCNSTALAVAGITRDTPQPSGLYAGGFDVDEDGELNGLFRDRAKRLIGDVIPPPTHSQRHTALAGGCHAYNAAGITAVIEPGLYADDMRVYQSARDAGDLTVRTGMMLGTWGFSPPSVEAGLRDWLDGFGLRSGFGDDLLWLDGAKFCPDGGVGDRTARFYEPYAGEPDNVGQWMIDPEQFPDLIRYAHDLGYSIDSHACGTAAQDLAVEAYAAALAENPNPRLRHRVHHAYFPSADAIATMARHRIGACVSTPFIVNLGESFVASVGEDRARNAIPLRSYIDAGVPVAGTSDSPITDFNPWVGIYAAVARTTIRGRAFNPDERISREEAIRLYTIWPATVTGLEASLGSLEPGKCADLIVLDRDPLTIPEGDLPRTTVIRTMLGGEWVYVR